MSILLDSIYEIAVLALGLIGFIWLAARRFEPAIYLTIILLPLYLLKINIFFVPFSVLEILIWLLFIIWLLAKRFKNVKLAEIKHIAWPALIILIAIILATLLSQNLKISAGILKGWFLAPLVFGLMVSEQIKGSPKIKKIFYSIFVSAFFVGLAALIYFFKGELTFDGRLKAFFLSSNHLAMYLAPGFLIGLGLQGMVAKLNKKAALWAGLAAIGVVLYLTFSYLAWLSILIMIIFWLVMNYQWKEGKKNKFIVYSLLFIVFLIILFFSQWGTEKLNNLLYSSRSSWQSRLMILKAAWGIAKDHTIFGIGPGMFQEYYLKYQGRFAVPYLEWAAPQPHNLFLAFWLQSGLLGLFGLLWLLTVFFKKIFSYLKQKNPLALILFTLMGYTLAHGLLDTTYFKNDLAVIFWVIVALVVPLAGTAQNKKVA